MLYAKNDATSYQNDFNKRFTNFCVKAPVLLSFSIGPKSVGVVEEVTNTVYEFEWDYTIPVKEFIRSIKDLLVEKCYPYIIKSNIQTIPMTIEEQTDIIQKGTPIDEVPTTKKIVSKEKYLIDKVIVYKDIFILNNLNTNKTYRYHLNKSSIYFLKNLQKKKMNPEEAGSFFFNHSELMNEIIPKDEYAKG